MNSPVVRHLVVAAAHTLAAVVALASAAPSARADAALASEARATMAKATQYIRSISTHGGYLWRYSPDLRDRAGEENATATQIWVQPPGTPSMGMAFLRAYEATGETQYLDAAEAAAYALAAGQLESGGWDYFIDFAPAKAPQCYRRTDVGSVPATVAAKRYNLSNYDDNNTQSALQLLLAVSDALRVANDARATRIREARDYGLAKLIAAQRPNGGWPQAWNGVPVDPADYPVQRARFPIDWPRHWSKVKYYRHYTLNDGTQRDCILTLLEASHRLHRPEYLAAALRGADFLLQAQLPEPQPAWAQQYNAQMEPAWARTLEPPAVCSAESVGVMRLLIDLYVEFGDRKYLEPIPRALAWLQRSEIAPGQWARLYEIGTNKPIFGGRDGNIYYRVEDLDPARQTTYAWKGGFGVAALIRRYDDVQRGSRECALASRDSQGRSQRAGAEPTPARVRAAIAALDAQGRWITPYKGAPAIQTDVFITNLRLLSDYVAVHKD